MSGCREVRGCREVNDWKVEKDGVDTVEQEQQEEAIRIPVRVTEGGHGFAKCAICGAPVYDFEPQVIEGEDVAHKWHFRLRVKLGPMPEIVEPGEQMKRPWYGVYNSGG